jgi:L-histidine Nalpha-methyltransferase / hercynylcysteine S-oxide synthase
LAFNPTDSGHIPTFLDIHLARVTTKKPTNPAYYTQIFERGIDPDMEDPTQCHPHSEVPDEWPSLTELLAFRDRVRQRLRSLYDGRPLNQTTKRALWLAYEHEVMHLETLLYMLIQSPKTRPPKYVPVPDWKEMATRGPKPMIDESARWQYFPGGEITVGLDDDEDDTISDTRFFGWDNENPRRPEFVQPFLASKRPITNGEYAQFLQHTNGLAPPSWTGNGPNWSVKTVFGPVPLNFAMDWPVMASYDDLNAYAQWKGGRLPTEGELRFLYDYPDMKDAATERSTVTIDAVNGHLTQNGVNTTPPDGTYLSASSSLVGTDGAKANRKQSHNGLTNGTANGADTRGSREDVFVSTVGKNIGLRHWHPMPLPAANKLSTGSHGGAWEWTCTTFDKHVGWKQSKVYPGYSCTQLGWPGLIEGDFFDTKHNVVLGGSWATLPRLAGRRTFRNWYQCGYGYVWAGGRVVKDLVN